MDRATLRKTLIDLLDASEQTLFRRAAVFAGGWALDAAEWVAADADVPDVLTALTSLADKNLIVVQADSTEPRFRMLETAREFAHGLLEASGEADTVRRRDAEFFATLAERAERQLQGAGQAAVVAQLERE